MGEVSKRVMGHHTLTAPESLTRRREVVVVGREVVDRVRPFSGKMHSRGHDATDRLQVGARYCKASA